MRDIKNDWSHWSVMERVTALLILVAIAISVSSIGAHVWPPLAQQARAAGTDGPI